MSTKELIKLAKSAMKPNEKRSQQHVYKLREVQARRMLHDRKGVDRVR